MKVKINDILFVFIMICLLMYGFAAEAVMMVAFLLLIIVDRNNVKRIVQSWTYRISILYIVMFTILFGVHIFILKVPSETTVRLYGLTKNICFPALMIIGCANIARNRFAIKAVMVEMIIFNLMYAFSFIFRAENEVISFQFGSVNGCGGVDIVLLPAVIAYLEECKNNSHEKESRALAYVFIASTIFFIAISDSSTSKIILIFETVAYAATRYFGGSRLMKNPKRIMIFAIFAIVTATILVATKRIELDPNELKTRVGIWTRAYSQFEIGDGVNKVFGAGNDIVHMLTKDLEPHNLILEILLIYGIAGLVVFLLFIFRILNRAIKQNKRNMKLFWFAVVGYFLVCSLHPFFSGSTIFQFNCMIGMLYLYFNFKENDRINT